MKCFVAVLLALWSSTALAAPQVQVVTLRRHASYYDATARYPRLRAATPLARFANAQLAKTERARLAEFVKNADDYIHSDDIKQRGGYSYESMPTIVTATRHLVSGYTEEFVDYQGAHPNTFRRAFNFGLVNGRPKALTVSDLFRANMNARARVLALLFAKLKREPRAEFVQDGTTKTLDTQQLNNFIVRDKSVTWLFNPYAVGSYAAGPIEVTLFTRELGANVNRALLGRSRSTN